MRTSVLMRDSFRSSLFFASCIFSLIEQNLDALWFSCLIRIYKMFSSWCGFSIAIFQTVFARLLLNYFSDQIWIRESFIVQQSKSAQSLHGCIDPGLIEPSMDPFQICRTHCKSVYPRQDTPSKSRTSSLLPACTERLPAVAVLHQCQLLLNSCSL